MYELLFFKAIFECKLAVLTLIESLTKHMCALNCLIKKAAEVHISFTQLPIDTPSVV